MAEESAGEADVARLAGSGDDVAGTDTESSSADEREGVDLIEKELTSALPWKQVIPLCLLQVSETFNSSGIFAYSAFLVSDFTGVSVDQAGFAAGFLQAASYFGMFLSSFGWGVASDRLGKRPCLLLGTTVWIQRQSAHGSGCALCQRLLEWKPGDCKVCHFCSSLFALR
jgi:hypothetical protein